jgi:hypothetical protein
MAAVHLTALRHQRERRCPGELLSLVPETVAQQTHPLQ